MNGWPDKAEWCRWVSVVYQDLVDAAGEGFDRTEDSVGGARVLMMDSGPAIPVLLVV